MKDVRNLVFGMMLVFVASVSQAQVLDEYVWMFDEGEGTTVTDDSGNFTAQFGASVTLPEMSEDTPSGIEGDMSVIPYGGFEVDDTEEPVLDLQEGPVTAEVWIKPINLSGFQDVFRIGNSLKAGFTNTGMLFTFLGIVDIPSGVDVPVDDAWHHVAYVWEPGVGVTFYLDGEEVAFVEETRAPRDFENSLLSIGSDHGGGSVLQANMDRLRIHNAVLGPDELDSDPANVADVLESTAVAYNFDEPELPYSNSTDAIRPAFSMAQEFQENSFPEFSVQAPTGEDGDFSVSFDGTDRIVYDDNEDLDLDIFDEPFTFQLWLKFNSQEQVAGRPVVLSYGIGGQGGYSFSFRPSGTPPESVEDSPSGEAGDLSVQMLSGLHVEAGDESETILGLREGPVTFEGWVYRDNADGFQDFIRIGNSLKAGFAGENLLFTFLGIVDMNSEVPVPINEWHHIAYVWEPGVGVTFYLDGEEVASIADDRLPNEFSNDNITIGADHNNGSLFQGRLDRVKVHNAVLTPDQLDSDPASFFAPIASTIMSYEFDEAGVPFANAVEGVGPAENQGNLLTVTTYGILDAHSNAEIPDDGMWHHVAVVFDFDGFAFRFYVDGELAQVMDYEDTVIPAPAGGNFLRFGSEGSGNFYVGLLDRVRINRGVVAQEDLDFFEPAQTPVEQWSLF